MHLIQFNPTPPPLSLSVHTSDCNFTWQGLHRDHLARYPLERHVLPLPRPGEPLSVSSLEMKGCQELSLDARACVCDISSWDVEKLTRFLPL